MVRIAGSHPAGPGSIPGAGITFLRYLQFLCFSAKVGTKDIIFLLVHVLKIPLKLGGLAKIAFN